MSNRTDIERVREAVDLVALISEYVQLQPKGREWVGVCPFHDDHKPSMSVVTHKENVFYKCFSCGAKGDCFAFLQNYLKMDFGEALRFLADRAGIELTNQPGQDESRSLRKSIRSAVEWASTLYRDAMTSTPEGKHTIELLHARGFNDDSIKQFSIGVVPDSWTYLSDRIKDNQSRIETCLEAGLIKKKESTNRVYDMFRHRMMFLIWDDAGSPVAFGGRRLNEEDEPKYINSPETVLFQKSKTLYGYHLARKEIQTLNRAIVVEGYTDVIACHQAGITNVVATLGTSLTPDHAAKLSRICDEVVLVFDGDDAGQRAADRAVEVFFAKEIDVRICVLPEGKDPAQLASDAQALQSYFDTSVDAIAFKLNRFEQSLLETGTISGRAKRTDAFFNELVRLGIGKLSGVRKPLVYERIASLIKVSMDDIHTFISASNKKQFTKSAQERTQSNNVSSQTKEVTKDDVYITPARRIAEREFLGVLLYDPIESSAALRENNEQILPEHFLDISACTIATHILPLLKAGTPCSMQELLRAITDESADLASSLYFSGQRMSETIGSVKLAVNETMKAMIRSIEDKAIQDKVHELKAVTDPEEQAIAAKQAIESIRKLKLSRSTL